MEKPTFNCYLFCRWMMWSATICFQLLLILLGNGVKYNDLLSIVTYLFDEWCKVQQSAVNCTCFDECCIVGRDTSVQRLLPAF